MAMEMGFGLRKPGGHSTRGRWVAEVHRSPSGRLYVITANTYEGWNDCPIKVDGKVLYDHPERIPAYAKRLTEQAFRWLEKNREELSK